MDNPDNSARSITRIPDSFTVTPADVAEMHAALAALEADISPDGLVFENYGGGYAWFRPAVSR